MKTQRHALRWQKLLAWVFFASCIWQQAGAQTLQANYGAPTTPFLVAGAAQTFKVKIYGVASTCSTGDSLKVSLPTGYQYQVGSAQQVTYTAGVAGAPSVMVLNSNPAANTATFKLGAIPANPDSAIITFKARAACGTIGGSGNNANYTLYTCSGTSTATSNAFNAQNAQLNITAMTNGAYTGASGDVYTRAITITNNGFGTIDTVYLDDVNAGGIAYNNIVTASIGTVAATTPVAGTTRFKVSGVNLAQGQSVVVTETVKITSCSNLSTSFDAWYGPNGVKCNGVNNTATAGASVNNALQPNMVVSSTPNYHTCVGTPAQQTITYTNTGTGIMKSPVVNLFESYYAYWSPSGIMNSPSHIGFDTTSFSYTTTASATPVAIHADSVKIFSTSTSLIAGKPANVYFTLPDIPAGASVTLKGSELMTCQNACHSSNFHFFLGLWSNYSYKNGCGEVTTSTSNQNLRGTNNISFGFGGVNIPSDMWPGNTYFAEYTNTSGAVIPTTVYPNGTIIRLSYTLPAQVAFSGLASDFVVTQNNGIALASTTPTSFVYNAAAHTLDIIYTIGANGFTHTTLYRAVIRINGLTTNCTASGSNNLSMQVFAKQAGCATCEMPVFCRTDAVTVHCPNPCPRGGVVPSNATIMRTNFGLPDNDNNDQPDASGNIDMNKVKTKSVTHGDTLQMAFYNKIGYGIQSPAAFTYGYIKNTFGSNTALPYAAINASISIYNAGGTLIGTCNNLPFTKTGLVGSVDFSISALAACGFPGAYTQYNNGDSMVIKVNYRVLQTPTSGMNIDELDVMANEWYVSPVANPASSADKYACDIVTGSFMHHALGQATNGNQVKNTTGCTTVETYADYHTAVGAYGYEGANRFPYEYRPVAIFDSLVYTVPAGFEYVSASAVYYYSNNGANSLAITSAISPLSTATNTLVFNIKNQYQPYGGTWPVSDEGSHIGYSVTLRPECSTTSGTYVANYYMTQTKAPANPTPLPYVSNLNLINTITYAKPSIVAVSPSANQTVTSAGVTWEVQVSNTTPYAASNVWMGKDAGISGVSITALQEITGNGGTTIGTPLTATGGVYQLGNFNSQMAKWYRITASYTSCVKDSMNLSYGYACDAYPATVAAAACTQNLKLTVSPQTAALQLSIIAQPDATPKQLCTTLDYEVDVVNVALGSATNLAVRAYLPATGGIAYTPGSFGLKYPNTATSYTAISDANVTANASFITFTIPAASLASLPATGTYRIKFSVNTVACQYISGNNLKFEPRGSNPCGTNLSGTRQSTNNIRLIGEPVGTNVFTITSSVDTAQACGNTASANYKFKLVNQGPNPTSTIDGFDVDLPSPWTLNTGTITYTHNPSSAAYSNTVTTGGYNVYNFASGTNLAVGDSIVFTATVSSPAAALACGSTDPIQENATVTFSSTCSTTSQVCATKSVLTNRALTTMYVSRPVYKIDTVVAEQNYVPGDTIRGYVTITRTSGNYVGQSVSIRLYKDANSNGIYDAGTDVFMKGFIYSVSSATTQTFLFVANDQDYLANFPIVATATFDCACTVAEKAGVLPVTFKSFTAKAEGNVSRLNWITAREEQNTGFNIERSSEGRIWNKIGFVPTLAENGSGNSELHYVYYDRSPLKGKNFYRLRQVDLDGKSAFSTIQIVNFGAADAIKLYPNPATQSVTIEAPEGSRISLFNIVGQRLEIPVINKGALQEINVSDIVSGTYTVQVISGSETNVYKLTVKH